MARQETLKKDVSISDDSEICGLLNITLETATATLLSTRPIDIPYVDPSWDMRSVLSYIATCYGASIRMTKDEKLQFVTLGTVPTNITRDMYWKAPQINDVKAYTKVACTINPSGEIIESGTGDSDHTLTMYSPYATNEIVSDLATQFDGVEYTPFKMEWKGLHWLEVGDAITIVLNDDTTISSYILKQSISFKGGIKYVSEAPSHSPQRSEFNYKGSLTQYVQNIDKTSLKEAKPYYGFTVTREEGLKVVKSDNSGTLIANSDKISLQANGVDKIYLDPVLDIYKMNGRLEAVDGVFSGNLSAVGGTFTGDLVAARGTFSGALQAATGTFSGDLQAAGGTFDGTLSGANGTFTGTVSAGSVVGGSIIGATISGGTISVETDLNVGNYIFVGRQAGTSITKGIGLFEGMGLSSAGTHLLMQNSRGDIYINPYGNLYSNGDMFAGRTYVSNNYVPKSGNVGFFGYSPVSQQSAQLLDSGASLADVIAKINGILNKLGLYGLFYVY